MNSVAESRDVYSNYLFVEQTESGDFGVNVGGEHLRTPAGKLVSAHEEKPLLHLISELEEHPMLRVRRGAIESPRTLCAYLIYSTQVDFVEEGKGISTDQIARVLDADPIFYPSAGQPWPDQLRAWDSVARFLERHGFGLHHRMGYDEDEWSRLVGLVLELWSAADPAQRSVVENLCAIFDGHFLTALLLAVDGISEAEFANSVIGASPGHYVFGSPSDDATSPEELHRLLTAEARQAASVCRAYLGTFNKDALELAKLIESGEGRRVEFKSSLRWDLREDRKNKAMSYAVLKTIAAFGNSEGGTLLIGVADSGDLVGIEVDRFENHDKFMLHLMDLIKNSINSAFASFVDVKIVTFQNVPVARVDCRRSTRPVYLRTKKSGNAEFFVRTGPATTALKQPDLDMYLVSHFEEPASGPGGEGQA